MAKSKRTRHTRSDSLKFQGEMVRDAIKGKEPPACYKLTKEQRYFWDRIIAARAEWTDIDLDHAINLAQTMAEIQAHRRAIQKEGLMGKCGNGAERTNPRAARITELTKLSVTLSSKLQIHATATIGDADEQVNKNRAKRLANEAVNGFEEDDEGLIAGPTH